MGGNLSTGQVADQATFQSFYPRGSTFFWVPEDQLSSMKYHLCLEIGAHPQWPGSSRMQEDPLLHTLTSSLAPHHSSLGTHGFTCTSNVTAAQVIYTCGESCWNFFPSFSKLSFVEFCNSIDFQCPLWGIQPPDSVIHLSSFLLIIFLDCLLRSIEYRAPNAMLLVLIDSVLCIDTVC